jgi:exodeoxyribonuclease V beta subunit
MPENATVSAATGFDLLGALPTGTTVLEASAGTGKTYAIVGLATRYVAEGIADLSELLLVTFSRAATQELRERTRARFAEVVEALADPESAAADNDRLIRHLAAHDVDNRRTRLRQALSDFDAATIATTHGFCQRMLDELGIAGEREPHVTVVEDVDDLTVDVVADIYLQRYGRIPPPITYAEAMVAARAAIFDQQAALAPQSADGTPAGERVGFAQQVRAEVERRKRATGLRDFDDQLALLHRVLSDPEHGTAACMRIRARFDVVLVDEFQDTDPKQWEILHRAFHGHSTLVLVGDPKQAIYAFRGAEVLSYLDAVNTSDAHRELTTNWRSDADLITALDHVYGGAALGDPRISVHRVDAARDGTRLSGTAPLRLRHLPRTGAGPLGKSGYPTVGPLRANVARDVAADVVALLDGNVTIERGGREEPVEPGHIAILVRTHAQVSLVYEELQRTGVPCVLAGGTSVFTTPAAQQWLWTLQALEQPHRADRVRLAALTPLLGYTAEDLVARGDELVAQVGGVLRDLAMVFAQSGFAALFERLATVGELEARLLRTASGERQLTDMRHIAELLDDAATSDSFGIASLTRWFEDRMNDPGRGSSDRSRRLDSDAAAVQILTVHGSKGLEFPVVYVPYAWDAAKNPNPDTLLLHHDGRRILDVGGEGSPGYGERRRTHEAEEAGEELRLLYVALTRACCQLTLWWAPSYGTARSPLHRVLFARNPGSSEVAPAAGIPADSVMAEQFASWAKASGGLISVEATGIVGKKEITWSKPQQDDVSLIAARFTRVLDNTWRRTSYSALTASAHDGVGVGSEIEEPEKDDEPEEPPLATPDPAAEGIPSTMNHLPGGTVFGTLVHAVFEIVDTSAADLEAELTACCRDVVAQRLSDIDPDELAHALLPVLHTRLGPLARTLADFSPKDRLAELDFELPLAGGDDPAAVTVTLGQVSDLLRRHLTPDDPLVEYADHVRTLEPVPLRGYLTGSIDAVLRIDGPRFVVVDYKTNRLAPGELTTGHYTRDAMAAEMIRAHYPMQALLYSVALHRYLRWRLPGYDPEIHLGGSQYLFVRGMAGPDSPPGSGVFDWTPPAALVTDLSDLLAGRALP